MSRESETGRGLSGVPAAANGCGKQCSWLSVPLVSAIVLLSGCSYLTGGADLSLSPDGAWVAYSYAKQWDLPLPPELPTICSKVWVRWCRLSKPGEGQVAEIGVFGSDWGGWDVKNRVHSVFSPDNRYLAVADPYWLRVVDCHTGAQKMMTAPGEVVTSLTWLDEDHLAYVACSRQNGGPGHRAVTHFWRQRIDKSPGERDLLFTHDEGPCVEKGLPVTAWPRERWSPDGRFVLFRSRGFRGRLNLLDVATGSAQAITPDGFSFEAVSWKSDGSGAACIGFKGSGEVLAFVIDPRTGEKRDFSEELKREFSSDTGFSAPSICPLWTPDDRYLLVNSGTKGGCLVQPYPWNVIPVARLLVDHLANDGSHLLAGEMTSRPPWAFWQPAKGWVRVWVQFQEKGYRRGMDYLVDYSGKSFVSLAESGAPGGGWKLTPDGRHAVKVEGAGKLLVREVRLPSSVVR